VNKIQKILIEENGKKIRIDTVRDTFLGSYPNCSGRVWYFLHFTRKRKKIFYAWAYHADENIDKIAIISEREAKRLLLENYGIEGSDYDMENILKIWPDFLILTPQNLRV